MDTDRSNEQPSSVLTRVLARDASSSSGPAIRDPYTERRPMADLTLRQWERRQSPTHTQSPHSSPSKAITRWKRSLKTTIVANHLHAPTPRRTTLFDSLIVAITHDETAFVTDPLELGYIPLPPDFNVCRLYPRTDGRYGVDDYVQWPQPYSKHYCHYPAIPTRPTAADAHHPYFQFRHLWDDVTRFDCTGTRPGLLPGMAYLSTAKLEQLDQAYLYLEARLNEERVRVYLDGRSDQHKFTGFFMAFLKLTLDRLHSIAAPPFQIKRICLDFHRGWLSVIAWSDYMFLFKPRMERGKGSELPAVSRYVMGTFVFDQFDVYMHKLAGIPVWFVQKAHTLSDHSLGDLAAFKSPESLIDIFQPQNELPMIWQGSGLDDGKYAALERDMLGRDRIQWISEKSVFDLIDCDERRRRDDRPFPARQPTGASEARQAQAVPYGQGKRKTPAHRVVPNMSTYEKYRDYGGDFAPARIPGWVDVNASIDPSSDQHKRISPKPKERGYYFPDPGLFVRAASEEKTNLYFHVWRRIKWWVVGHRETACEAADAFPPGFWRGVLSYPRLHREQGEEEEGEVATRSSEKLKEVRRLLDEIAKAFPDLDGADFNPVNVVDISYLPAYPTVQRKAELFALSIASFRMELLMLDRKADQSFKLPWRGPTTRDELVADVQMQLRQHRTNRELIHSKVFPRSGTLLQDVGDSIFAVDPKNRRLKLGFLWLLMSDWPGYKETLWSEGFTLRLPEKHKFTDDRIIEFEEMIAKFYSQTFYDYFGRPPVLPRSCDRLPGDLPLL